MAEKKSFDDLNKELRRSKGCGEKLGCIGRTSWVYHEDRHDCHCRYSCTAIDVFAVHSNQQLLPKKRERSGHRVAATFETMHQPNLFPT